MIVGWKRKFALRRLNGLLFNLCNPFSELMAWEWFDYRNVSLQLRCTCRQFPGQINSINTRRIAGQHKQDTVGQWIYLFLADHKSSPKIAYTVSWTGFDKLVSIRRCRGGSTWIKKNVGHFTTPTDNSWMAKRGDMGICLRILQITLWACKHV